MNSHTLVASLAVVALALLCVLVALLRVADPSGILLLPVVACVIVALRRMPKQ